MDLQDLITGIQQVEIPESFVNQLLHDHGLNHTVQIRNNSIVLYDGNFKAEFFYHSYNFNNSVMTVDFCLHTIKPFYYSFGLQLLNKKYPWLEYWNDHDGNKMITCHLDRIPGIDGFLEDYKPCIKDTDIESISFRKGQIIVGFRK